MTEKIYLYALGNGFLGTEQQTYKETNLDEKALEIGQMIKKLQEKQAIINQFTQLKNANHAPYIVFSKIKNIACMNHWHDYHQSGDGYELSEEILAFEIQTDYDNFAVLLECVGSEGLYDKSVYYLHTPSMDETKTLILKDALLNKVERSEKVLIIHPYTTVEKEQEILLTNVTCINDCEDVHWWNDSYTNFKFEKGKVYPALINEHDIKVQYKPNHYVKMYDTEAELYFGVKCEIEPTLRLDETTIEEFDSFLREINEDIEE